MFIGPTEIEATFAEAFPITGCAVQITAVTRHWANVAANLVTGYATSVIACDVEAGIERQLPESDTADGRPGVQVAFYGFSRPALEKAIVNRLGQCVLTCPTTACYNATTIDHTRFLKIGGNLRFFGDGFQQSKLLGNRRFWRIPVMDGEFICEDQFGTFKGVAGGNFLILAESQTLGLTAAEKAVHAIFNQANPQIILPFPGGVVRSGSKVGSKYKQLKASTNQAYCPTLRGKVATALNDSIHAVYEIVIDGVDQTAVERAMALGIRAACGPGIVRISAGNYGGKLGPFHLQLQQILAKEII